MARSATSRTLSKRLAFEEAVYRLRTEKLLSLLKTSETHSMEVRVLAKKMKIPQQEVVDLAEDLSDRMPVDVMVGFRTGLGIGTYTRIGDYWIEYYGSEASEHDK